MLINSDLVPTSQALLDFKTINENLVLYPAKVNILLNVVAS